MPLIAGDRLGPYRIVASLGAGGMGEVYRARDSRLDRIVAVKVLPAHLSSDPELRRRLEREAKAISGLNHPNICVLHDIGHDDGVDFLVMEHLEGQSLADRLLRGALPLEQAMRHGIEIADALTLAHRHGVVHRDLKPGNVMLVGPGKHPSAKLLDFGLAKLSAAKTPSGREPLSAMTATEVMPLTAEGMVIGTLHYMAPEQLEGGDVDARSDLFAFGAVIYEMVTGHRAFAGGSPASLIAAIMGHDPEPISAFVPTVPANLERLVGRCLAKDPDERWQTACDLAAELRWIAEHSEHANPEPAVVEHRAAPSPSSKLLRVVGWSATAVLLALLSASLGRKIGPGPSPAAPAIRFTVLPPEGNELMTSVEEHNLAVSPDGLSVAFVASAGERRLWVRDLAALEARPLPGSEGAGSPFWSPDSRFLAFFADGKLKKIEAAGGRAHTLCEVEGDATGSWGAGGVLLFTRRSGGPGIYRVAETGGAPAAVLTGDHTFRWPYFLPGGRRFLYGTGQGIHAGSIEDGTSRRLLSVDSRAVFSTTGHLLYVREGALLAQPFDPGKLIFDGEPFTVVPSIPYFLSGWAPFSVSETGVLAYRPSAPPWRLARADRRGERQPLGKPGRYQGLRLSPDGNQLALETLEPQTSTSDLWIYDLARGVETRFTFDRGLESSPVWSADGREIIFLSHGFAQSLRRKLLGTPGDGEPLLPATRFAVPTDWTPDNLLVYSDGGDLWLHRLDGDGDPSAFLETPFLEHDGVVSPDGHWLAYVSDESGAEEVYVQALAGSGRRWRISNAGGRSPRWRPDGRELFYLAAEGSLMATRFDVTAGSGPESPVALFRLAYEGVEAHYDVTADGQSFLVNPGAEPTAIHVVLSWPPGKRPDDRGAATAR